MSYAAIVVTYNREALLRECLSFLWKQVVAPERVILVNNASTDGTAAYLETLRRDTRYSILDLPENTGGAGGFEAGLRAAGEEKVDWLLLIDDDAMLRADYMAKILDEAACHPDCLAYAGTVCVDGHIDTDHRKTMKRPGLLFHPIPESVYTGKEFPCDGISFCGLVIARLFVQQIGLPHGYYFIWHDDTEYSIRIRAHSEILVVPEAVLDHRTALKKDEKYRRYTRKDYYGIRNRIWYVSEHGTWVDRIVNRVDLFVNVIFRNRLFRLIRMDGYDWKAECGIVEEALKDAQSYKRDRLL